MNGVKGVGEHGSGWMVSVGLRVGRCETLSTRKTPKDGRTRFTRPTLRLRSSPPGLHIKRHAGKPDDKTDAA